MAMYNNNNIITLSQESDLINSDAQDMILKDLSFDLLQPEMIDISLESAELDSMYQAQIIEQSAQREDIVINESTSATGTFPCLEEYKGPLNFELFVDGSRASKKSWVYSQILHKVYLDMNKVLLIQFKINSAISGLRIRSLPVYNVTDCRRYPVDRCTTHSVEVDPHSLAHKEKGKCLCADYQWVGHVVQSSHHDARYEYDSQSGRHSVTVPLDGVQPGCDTVTVPYHFTCKTSCPIKGMGRKPIDIIFTLETATGDVIGRQRISAKICSCPKRDKSREEVDHRVTNEDEREGLETSLPHGKCKRKSDKNVIGIKKIKVEKTPTPIAADSTKCHSFVVTRKFVIQKKLDENPDAFLSRKRKYNEDFVAINRKPLSPRNMEHVPSKCQVGQNGRITVRDKLIQIQQEFNEKAKNFQNMVTELLNDTNDKISQVIQSINS